MGELETEGSLRNCVFADKRIGRRPPCATYSPSIRPIFREFMKCTSDSKVSTSWHAAARSWLPNLDRCMPLSRERIELKDSSVMII